MARISNKPNKTGRNTQKEHWTKLTREIMELPAWRALSTTAQALYPWLRLEWKGPHNNNNGKIQLSVRQAAAALGVTPTTASHAFHDLQKKGFIVMTSKPCLGVEGLAKAPRYELTEIALPYQATVSGRRLFKNWDEANEYPINKVSSNNPKGLNGKTRHQFDDDPVIIFETFRNFQSSK